MPAQLFWVYAHFMCSLFNIYTMLGSLSEKKEMKKENICSER